jgi:hypothetical protein
VSDEGSNTTTKPTLLELIGRLPTLLVGLAKDELEQAKREVSAKLKRAGVGSAFLAIAAALAFYFLGTLVAAAVLGVAVVFPAWLAALIVAGGLLMFVGIFALVGVNLVKKAMPPLPTKSVESIKHDLKTIKGVENRGE